ncbi:MAG: hypothetical protein V7603_431 [Micromonosporaceae bacterium]
MPDKAGPSRTRLPRGAVPAAFPVQVLGCAVGAGVVAGAGQLGVAYGLGILRWDAGFASGTWHWQLTWLALLASIAVIVGAATGQWRAGRSGIPVGLPLRVAAALAAALGAVVMIPLVLHPARVAHVSEPGSPALTAVIATSAGLVLGIVAAVAVLTEPTVAGNIVATVTWLWLVALGSAVWTIGRGEAWGEARPGLLPVSGAGIPLLLLGMPALVALVVAAVARFGGAGPVRVAISGVAGPALLAAAYLIGAPGGGTQTSSYQYALLGVAVAAAVSVLVAVARRPAIRLGRGAAPQERPARRRAADEAPAPRDEAWTGGAHRLPAWTDAPDDSAWPADDSPTDPLPATGRGTEPDETTQPLPPATLPPKPQPASPSKAADPPKPRPASTAKASNPPKPQPASPTKAGNPPKAEPGGTNEPGSTNEPGDTNETGDTNVTAGTAEAAAPAKRTGRRGRRRGQDAGEQPVATRDADYVDWVRALGGSGNSGEPGEG